MILFGLFFSGKISDWQVQSMEEYNKALKIESAELFEYGMNTNVGNAFVYGELKAVDAVTFDELEEAYLYVKKVEEHYNRHIRTVTKTKKDSNGNTVSYQETEVYYTWDEYKSWKKHSEKISFLGVEFDYSKISHPGARCVKTLKKSSNVRYKYYACDSQYVGTIYTELRNETISDNSSFYNNKDISKVLKSIESANMVIVFWIIWIGITVGVVYGFYSLDNDWLH